MITAWWMAPWAGASYAGWPTFWRRGIRTRVSERLRNSQTATFTRPLQSSYDDVPHVPTRHRPLLCLHAVDDHHPSGAGREQLLQSALRGRQQADGGEAVQPSRRDLARHVGEGPDEREPVLQARIRLPALLQPEGEGPRSPGGRRAAAHPEVQRFQHQRLRPL